MEPGSPDNDVLLQVSKLSVSWKVGRCLGREWRLLVGTQQQWKKFVQVHFLLIRDVIPENPAFNKVRTLY